jgi:hypothetical protein
MLSFHIESITKKKSSIVHDNLESKNQSSLL